MTSVIYIRINFFLTKTAKWMTGSTIIREPTQTVRMRYDVKATFINI